MSYAYELKEGDRFRAYHTDEWKIVLAVWRPQPHIRDELVVYYQLQDGGPRYSVVFPGNKSVDIKRDLDLSRPVESLTIPELYERIRGLEVALENLTQAYANADRKNVLPYYVAPPR